MLEQTTASPDETIEIAKEFARNFHLTHPNISTILLSGELGAGKTTFTKGIALGLDIDDIIQSPTYTITRPYPLSSTHSPFTRLVHCDLYRINAEWEIDELGIKDYIMDNQTLLLVEWPEKATTLWQTIDHCSVIFATHTNAETSRTIVIT